MKACFVLVMLFGLLAIASPMDAVCKMKLEAGPCMALFRRYGYSTEKQKCVEFSYGGCQGNANNFETMEACRKKCT